MSMPVSFSYINKNQYDFVRAVNHIWFCTMIFYMWIICDVVHWRGFCYFLKLLLFSYKSVSIYIYIFRYYIYIYRERERGESSNVNSYFIVNVRATKIVSRGIFSLSIHVLFRLNNIECCIIQSEYCIIHLDQ